MTHHHFCTRSIIVLSIFASSSLFAPAVLSLEISEAAPTPNTQIKKNIPAVTFDIEKFEQNLKQALNNESIGYTYAIVSSGQLKKSGANGYAVLKRDLVPNSGIYPDPKGLNQHPNKRMNIASITKPITATAVLKTIQDKSAPSYPNLTINSKIAPFLPSSWKLGTGVKDLTFKELLSQYSGMDESGSGTSLTAIKDWIAKGVTRPKTDYKYINSNLAIFRIILPYMRLTEQQRGYYSQLYKTEPQTFDTKIANLYKEIVKTEVFQKAGIKNAEMYHQTTNPDDVNSNVPTRLYHAVGSIQEPNRTGTLTGDWTLTGGGGGWYLSAVDLAKFLAYIRFSNDILNQESRDLMFDKNNCPGANCRPLGWQTPFAGKYGNYYFHGGDLFYGNKPEAGKPDIRNGMNGSVITFPNGIQASLLINSRGHSPSANRILIDAFDSAWSK